MTPDICECGHKRQKHKWDMFANPQECLKDGCPCKKFTPQNTHQSPPYLKGEEIADKKPSDNSDYISSDVGLKTSGDFSNSKMSKSQFENTDKPLSIVLSYDPIKNKTLFSYFEGNAEDMLEKFKKDFPTMFHFHRSNMAQRRKWAKEIFNYDI